MATVFFCGPWPTKDLNDLVEQFKNLDLEVVKNTEGTVPPNDWILLFHVREGGRSVRYSQLSDYTVVVCDTRRLSVDMEEAGEFARATKNKQKLSVCGSVSEVVEAVKVFTDLA